MGAGLRPGPCTLSLLAQLSERGDSQSRIPEPPLHLQNGKCCPAYFTAGFENLVKEQIQGKRVCALLQVCVPTISQMRQCRRAKSGPFLGPHSQSCGQHTHTFTRRPGGTLHGMSTLQRPGGDVLTDTGQLSYWHIRSGCTGALGLDQDQKGHLCFCSSPFCPPPFSPRR